MTSPMLSMPGQARRLLLQPRANTFHSYSDLFSRCLGAQLRESIPCLDMQQWTCREKRHISGLKLQRIEIPDWERPGLGAQKAASPLTSHALQIGGDLFGCDSLPSPSQAAVNRPPSNRRTREPLFEADAPRKAGATRCGPVAPEDT